MKIYCKILMINLIIGLFGTLPLFAMDGYEGKKRKLPDEFCRVDLEHTKRQRTQEEGWSNQERPHFDNGTLLLDDNWVKIFSYIERKDTVQMSQVCQSWYNLTINLYWPNTVIDRSDKLTFVCDLLDLFPNPNPYNIKVQLSEGESTNFYLLQGFRQVSLIIAKYDYKDYQGRYVELSNKMEDTKKPRLFLKRDFKEVYNPTYNNRDFIAKLQFQMMQVNRILMLSHTISGCFNPNPISHLVNLENNLVFLQYMKPSETCICDSLLQHALCTCNPIAKFICSDLYHEFPHISNLSNLKSLTLTSDSIHPSEIHFISTLTNLTYLDMSNDDYHHQDHVEIEKPFQPFSSLKNLTYLNLSEYNSWSPARIDSLSVLTSLTELNLDSAIDDVKSATPELNGRGFLNVSFLGNLKHLTNLGLSYLACSRKSLEALSGLEQLKKLTLTNTVLDDNDEKRALATLSTFTTLTHLDLCRFAPIPENNNEGIIEYVETNMSIEEFQDKYGIQHMDPYILKEYEGNTLFLKEDFIKYFLPLKKLKKLGS